MLKLSFRMALNQLKCCAWVSLGVCMATGVTSCAVGLGQRNPTDMSPRRFPGEALPVSREEWIPGLQNPWPIRDHPVRTGPGPCAKRGAVNLTTFYVT